jgi:hypothetical protein
VIQIGIGVFIGAIEREDELLSGLLPGNEIQAQDNRGGDIVDVHGSLPEPARPVAIAGVHVTVPVGNKPPGAKGDHVHVPVLSVILGNQFGQDFAAPVPCIRPVNTGRGNEDDLVDAVGSSGFEYLEGAAHIQVKEIVGIFVATIFVDAVPGGDVDDAIAAAQCLYQLRPVQDGPLDKPRSLFQIPWSAKVENDRCVALGEQPGHKSLAEISGPSGQQHLHHLLPDLPRFAGQYAGRPDRLSA